MSATRFTPPHDTSAVRAVHAVTEAQQRGSLHLHLLLWAEYGPTVFARHIHYSRDVRAQINAYITAYKQK